MKKIWIRCIRKALFSLTGYVITNAAQKDMEYNSPPAADVLPTITYPEFIPRCIAPLSMHRQYGDVPM